MDEQKHTIYGKTSLILGLMLIFSIVIFALMVFFSIDISNFGTMMPYVLGILLIIAIIAIILGAIAYFKLGKDTFGRAGLSIGIMMLLVLPSNFLVLTDIFSHSDSNDSWYYSGNEPPTINFIKDNDAKTLTVESWSTPDRLSIRWEDITINGNCELTSTRTFVRTGQIFVNCSGKISFIFKHSNSEIATYEFIWIIIIISLL